MSDTILQPTDAPQNSGATRQLTFGEKLVGLNFNPSNDDKVSKAKRLCAELADLVNENCPPEEEQWDDYVKRMMRDHAFMSILDAQMNAVKVLTLKY